MVETFKSKLTVECPVCGMVTNEFKPYGVVPRPNALCPKCGSLERHRLLWLFLRENTNIFSKKIKVLDIAPIKGISEKLKTMPNIDYVSVDLNSRLAMIHMDITEMDFPENYFDCILCYHVLEHIPDDNKAMKELLRVLKPDGWSVLQVPIDTNLKFTVEGTNINDPQRRRELFGQEDHVRLYGLDYKDRLEDAGFKVEINDFAQSLSQEDLLRYSLMQNEKIYLCHKPYKSRKKILFINHNLYPYELSGTPMTTRNHALGMVRRGMEVAVLIPSHNVKKEFTKDCTNEFILYQIPVLDKMGAYLSEDERIDISKYRKTIEEIIDDFSPQIVHINDYVYMPAEIIEIFSKRGCIVVREVCNCEELCHHDYPVITSGLTGKLCTGPENPAKCTDCLLTPFTSSIKGSLREGTVKFIKESIEHRFRYIKKLYRENIDKVIFTSEPFKNYFTNFISIAEDKIKVIPRGFDFALPRLNQPKPGNDGIIHFAFVGNIMFSKGIDIALQAFEKICTKYQFVFHVYGQVVNSEYNDWLDRLKSKYPDKFIYHGKFEGDEIPEIAGQIDICLITSYFDTYNRVLREFLYFGVPVISTDFFGAYIIRDGKNGFKITVGDVEALTERMIEIIRNPERVKELRCGANETQIPTLDEECNMMLETYNELITQFAETNKGNFRKIMAPDKNKQSSINDSCRAIAFYLPQYHPTPENDRWWGKGFTEWTNVTKAKPLFPGHYQPHLPADLGFYDLRLAETRKAQAKLAKQYGISGFCYYHYWFNGKRLLNRVFDEVLLSGKPDFPFCLCWANENWTRAWDGSDNKILIEQHYSSEDDLAHIKWLIQAFMDPRYIKIQGKPLLLIYRASDLPEPKGTADLWREETKKAGFPDLYLCKVESFASEKNAPTDSGFDASIEFQPDWSNLGNKNPGYQNLDVYEYDDIVNQMIKKPSPEYMRFPCVTPSWDNSPRRGRDGCIFHSLNPRLYEKWLRHAISKVDRNVPDEKIIFINAWNEWGEGNHLEPDQRYGHSYLNATRRALTISKERANLNEQITKQAAIALESGAVEEAKGLLLEALTLSDSSPETLHQYALLLFQEGNIDKSCEVLLQALESDPGNAEYHNDLGAMYHSAGDHARAIMHFQRTLEIDPHDITTLKNLTELYIEKGQFKDAHSTGKKLIEISPSDIEVKDLWSMIENKLGSPPYKDVISCNEATSDLKSENSYQDPRWMTSNTSAISADQPEGLVCLQPFYMIEFTTNGLVYSCCPAWTKVNLGHIGKSSIAEIWNSDKAKLIRRKLLKGQFQDVCNNICPHIAEHRHSGKLIRFDELERIETLTPELIEEIRAGRDHLTSQPTVFNLSNSTVCNLSCIMCTRHSDGAYPELVQKTAMELESYLPKAKRITLSGMGDPFARPDTRNIMINNSNKNLTFDLITNGLLLPRYWNDVRSCRFGNLLISVDASDQQTYEKIRRGGKWKDLLFSLSLIHENHHRFQSVTLNMTVMRENAAKIQDFINFAESYGFNASFQRIRGMYGDQNIFELNDRSALETLSNIVTMEKGRSRSIGVYLGDLLEFVNQETIEPIQSSKVTVRTSGPKTAENVYIENDFKTTIADVKKINQQENAKDCRGASPVMKGGPLTAIVSVGSKCNLRCQMCFRTINNIKGSNLPWSTFKKTLEFLPALQRVKLIGAGEPFLNPDYFKMLEAVKNFNLETETVSNGTLITDEIARKIVLSGLGSLCISLDGATAGTYESIRRGAKFHNVLEGIKRINKYKKEFHSITPVMGFSTVIMRRNVKELPAVIELAKKLNLSWVTVLYLTVFAPDLIPESLFFYHDLSDRMLITAKERAKQLGISIDTPALFNEVTESPSPVSRKKCFEPWQMVMIEVGGEVLPCCTYGTPLGNLNESNFFEIWNNEKYQDLRRRVNSNTPPDPCRHCSNSTVAHSVNDIKSHIRCAIPKEFEKLRPIAGESLEKKFFKVAKCVGQTQQEIPATENSKWGNKNHGFDSAFTSKALHESAILLFRQGQLFDAIKTMQNLLASEPDNAEINNDLGAMYHASGDIVKAQEYFEKALKLDPDDITSLKNLTELYIAREQLDDALTICSRLKSLYPDDKETDTLWNLIHARLGIQAAPDTANSIEKNRNRWSNYDWPSGGDEWSSSWGGTENLWEKTILPRIDPIIPAGHILEIAPGFGRCTQFLAPQSQKLSIVDLTEKCIEACKQRFTNYQHISYFVNDGKSLNMIDDNSIDFVFSWDSLVHVENSVMESYLHELAAKLKPGGVGFLHHSNIGAFKDPVTGKLTVENPHWRGESMSAELFREYCKNEDIQCLSQEIIAWGGNILNDCLSTFIKNGKGIQSETVILENSDFMAEGRGKKTPPDIYKHLYPLVAESNFHCVNQIMKSRENHILEEHVEETQEGKKLDSSFSDSNCLISIVMTLGNTGTLNIKSILKNIPNQGIELIIVDNASNNNIKDYLNRLNRKDLTIITPDAVYSDVEASLLGAEKASGTYLMFIDSSVLATKTLFRNTLNILENSSNPDAIVGNTINRQKTIIESGATTICESVLKSRGEGIPFNDPAYSFTSDVGSGSRYCMLIRKEIWEEVGRFNKDFKSIGAALIDLGMKITSRGYHIQYRPQCILINSDIKDSSFEEKSFPDSEILSSLRPKDLPIDLGNYISKTDHKNVLVLGIYLANQMNNVKDIVSVLDLSNSHKVLQKWVALNGSPPDEKTAEVTVNILNGRFPKFQIINELLHDEDISIYDYIILCDDDVVLPENFIDAFITMQSRFEFAIAQPARTLNSHIDHPIVEQHIGVHARQTNFVEIGPVTSFHRSAYDFIFPFDVTSPMGWGYENVWAYEALQRDLKIGIIDGVCVDHSLRKPVANYGWDQADRERSIYLKKHDHLPLEDCFRVVSAHTISEESI